MKGMEGKILKMSGGLTLVAVEDDGALLDVERRCYYDLNNTATFLLKHLEEGQKVENLLAKMRSEFNVNEETASRDMEDFIAVLMKKKLLHISDSNIDYSTIVRNERGVKPYRSPLLEYQTELVVAAAQSVATPN